MGISIDQAKACLAFYLRRLTFFVFVIAAAVVSELGSSPVKVGGAMSPFEPGSSVASQPASSYFKYPQATPTAFPDEIRFAIIAHALECVDEKGGMLFNGLGFGDMHIYYGSIFSNACIVASGGIEVILESQTSVGYFVTEYDENGGATIIPTPELFPNPIDISYVGIPEPDCSLLPVYGEHSGEGVIYPGVYENITLTDGTLKLMPGLYCVLGDVDFLAGEAFADGVTLFIEGDFTSTGSAVVRMHAPQKRVAPQQGIADVLLYLGEGSHAMLYNKGNNSFSGVVYAPGDSTEIVLSGYGTITTQLVAHTVKLTPYGNLDVVLDPLHSYPKEALSEIRVSHP